MQLQITPQFSTSQRSPRPAQTDRKIYNYDILSPQLTSSVEKKAKSSARQFLGDFIRQSANQSNGKWGSTGTGMCSPAAAYEVVEDAKPVGRFKVLEVLSQELPPVYDDEANIKEDDEQLNPLETPLPVLNSSAHENFIQQYFNNMAVETADTPRCIDTSPPIYSPGEPPATFAPQSPASPLPPRV